MSICLYHVSELMPRQTNFDRFKLHTDRSVVNELKTELWNTKAVSDLQNPNHLFSIPSRFFAKHDSDDLSDSDCEPVHSFVNKCLQSYCHKSRPASEDVAIKLQLLEEKLSGSRFEVSLSKMSIHFYGLWLNTAFWPSSWTAFKKRYWRGIISSQSRVICWKVLWFYG